MGGSPPCRIRASARGGNLLSETRPMKLYFLRHAEAEDGPVDADRRLTGKGRRDARRLGLYLEESGVEFGQAFTSPLIRARETAAQVLKECPLPRKAQLTVADSLRNGTTAVQFFRWLRAVPEVESMLLVGHEPSLSAWVRKMLGIGNPRSLPLAKGFLARVDTENRKTGVLRLLIGAKFLA